MTEPTARRRIVAGVDSSAHAARAAAWAAREAVDRGLTLHLAHAMNFPPPADMIAPVGYVEAAHDEVRKLLAAIARDLREQHPGLINTTEASELDAAELLVALSGSAQLVVTGTRGHGGFARLLLGSVSLKTAAHAHCPAVVVRGEQPEHPLAEIVLGAEPHESDAPIEFAFAGAAALGASLRVVRAWWPARAYGGYYFDDEPSRERREAEEVDRLIKGARERHPDVKVTTDVVRDNAVPALIKAAHRSRLLVIGAHRRRSPLSMGAGYVVQGMLSHSPTPVAVVPIV